MKKIAKILSFLGIVIATAWLIILYSSEIPSQASSWEDFPINETQFIDFRADKDSFNQLTQRERKDQLRDWLLFTVVSDKSFSVDEVNKSLYDLSTFRYGYMKPVSNFEYGDTRSLYIGDGKVVALLPEGISEEERIDELAHIADKHRQNIGKIPTSLLVFKYEINLDEQYALLTRREELDGQKIFTDKDYGYHESKIKNLDDLQHFLNQVDDITFAQVKGSSLTLGGRKIRSRQYRGIGVEDVAAIWQSEKKFKKSGFSLDPSYDYRGLENMLNEVKPALQLLKLFEPTAITEQDIQNAKLGLAEDKIDPYLVLANELAKSDNPRVAELGKSLDEIAFSEYGFQTARYDGNLQGTEVGMVLFYTDLLAKLWGFNYTDSTPEKYIQGFNPKTKISVSSIYRKELKELRRTRTWFEPNDKGFQVADEGNRLIFARNATKVNARSSNHLQANKEVAATAITDAFLSWWNGHYEEVARYEPQYEKLNEIMKWSLLIGWLNESNRGELLEFLQEQEFQVKRDNWFPDWVQANIDQLTFKRWDEQICREQLKTQVQQPVCFYKRGYKGTKTEAMPILVSEFFKQFGEQGFLVGGVSLGSKDLFDGRSTLSPSTKVPELTLRANLNYNSVERDSNSLKFKTFKGTTYNLESANPDFASVTVVAGKGEKSRSHEIEFANPPEFIRNVSSTDSGLQIDTYVGETNLGTLSTARIENGFTVDWHSQEIDAGISLALELSQVQENDMEKILLESSMVKWLLKLPDEPAYLVKMHGSEHWLKVAPEESVKIPSDWQARAGGLGANSGVIYLAWVDEQTVTNQLDKGIAEPIRYDSSPSELTYESFMRNLVEQKYDVVAQELAEKPQEFGRLKEKYLRDKLGQTDGLLRDKNYAEAEQSLDDLISSYGQQPNLVIRKAVAGIGRSRLNVELVTSGLPHIDREQSRKNFLDEVNGLLEATKSMDKFVIKDMPTALFYIQDFPGLNNIDWALPIEQIIPLISTNDLSLYEVRPGKIGYGGTIFGDIGYDESIFDSIFIVLRKQRNLTEPSLQNYKMKNAPNRDQGGSPPYPENKCENNKHDKCDQ